MTSNQAPDDTPSPIEPPTRHNRRASWGAWAILLIALLLGGYFRTIALFDWDEPSYRLHPDERFMLMVAADNHLPSSLEEYLDSSVNPLNPRNRGHTFYVYGMLPQLLTRLTAVMLTPNALLPPTVPYPRAPDPNSAPQVPNPELDYPKLTVLEPLLNPRQINLTDFYQIHKVGRSLSALFDMGSILLTFLVARRLYSRRVAALAALLYALAVLPIQLTHFFAVDSTSGFFVLLAIYCAVRIAQGGGPGSYVVLGMSIGAAMACRITLATLGLIGVVAVAQRLWQNRRPTTDHRPPTTDAEERHHPLTRSPAHPLTALGLLALAGILSVLTFRLLQPDAFIGTSFFDLRPEPRFIANIAEIGRYVSGEAESPPSDQWANRTAYLFPLTNMVLWGMGLPFGVAAWAGWLAAGWQLFRRRALAHLLPWLSIALYFAWQGGILNPSMRYFVVLYGLFAAFAAWALVAIWDRRRPTTDDRRPTTGTTRWWSVVCGLWSVVGRMALVVVVIGTLCWAYAFTRIYTRPHSRITASRWIYQNIPPGAKISAEQWDDGLPLNLDGRSASQYIGVEMLPYAEDDPIKYTGFVGGDGKYNQGLLDQLDQLDYIILSSNRIYGSTSRLPMRFPALMRYYHYLFSGELGFKLVADINSYPTLFGIPIPDQGAEEAFSVYDHPRVLIFKKSLDYSRQRAAQLITGDVAWGEVYKLPVVRVGREPTALRLTETQWQAYRDGGTWASLFNPASLTNQLPWLFWLLAMELLGLAIFPLLFWLLPGLPDRGFALAKTLGLLVVAYGAWLLGSLHVMSFTPGSVWLCTAALIALGVWLARRNKAELLAFARERRTALLSAEGLFLLAFFGFLLVRAANPDLWHPARGGEKPMDLAFLNAVLKSAAFPPYDPWFAGGYINYYYFGLVLVGALIHLTGIVPTVAYNLAVPTIFALTALGAWGVAYNLIALRRPPTTDHQPPTTDRPHTQYAIRNTQYAIRERRAITTGIVAAVFVVLVGNLANAFWLLPGSATALDPREPATCQLSSYAEKERCKGRDEWVFWDATRLISISLSTPENNDGTISEFPFFTFLYGDLHAHMIALPLALAALGLMVALARTKYKVQSTRDRTALFSVLCSLFFLALVVGALRATNTWDYPAYLGLSVVTLGLLAWDRRRRGASWISTIGSWALAALGLLLLSTLLFLPFTRNFATDYAGFELWHGARTLASDYLKINGLWLFLLGSAALALYQRIYGFRLWQLALLAAVVLLAVAIVVQHMIALVLLVPLAGLSVALAFELLNRGESVVSCPSSVATGHEPPTDHRPPTTDHRPAASTIDPAPTDDGPRITDHRLLADTIDPAPTDDGPRITDHGPRITRVSLTTLLPVLWAIGALWLTLMVELIVAKGDGGRMNTVFKLGMQSWVLFAVSSAIALTWLWGLTARWLADRPPTTDHRPPQPALSAREEIDDRRPTASNPFSILNSQFSILVWAWRGAAALLVAAALVYPITATPVRLADRYDPSVGMTLDGAAYMRSVAAGWGENGKNFTFAEDADAIDWMRTNIRGTPIVLEAQTEAYRWGGRISIYTGLPTLLGWPGHERQQRAVALVDPVIESRRILIDQLYTTTSPSETLQLLRLYGVEYVYVGQLERALYGDSGGLAKFDTMAASGQLQQIYARGETRIYQLLPADHPPAVLTTALSVQPPALPREKSLLLDTPVDQLPAVNEYSSSGGIATTPVGAVLLWLLAGYVLLLLGLPVAVLVFGGDLHHGGHSESRPTGGWEWAWAQIIGLLLLGYAVWLPVSARLWRYDRMGLFLGILFVLALDAVVLAWLGKKIENEEWRTEKTPEETPSSFFILHSSFWSGLRALREHLLAHRRQILIVEGLFLGAFAFMVALRMLNPDLWQPIWGGEKPFEFGFLNAILRSPVMPPYDPFFSNGTINYYYYGLFLVSLPVKATGIDPAVAFNLIIPTLYAITVTGAFALVARLTGKIRYGLAGAAFLALLGNLAAAFPAGDSRGIGPVRDALLGGLSGFGARLGDWFWGPSRVITIPGKLLTINEFPYWSFLFADLHPHLIALPIAVLMIAIVYELFDDRRPTTDDRRPTDEHLADEETGDRRQEIALRSRVSGLTTSAVVGRWLLAALTLGALAVTNSWDFPTYALLLGGALLGRAWRSSRRPTTDHRPPTTDDQPSSILDPRSSILDPRSSIWIRMIGVLVTTVLIAGGALLLYLPFFQSFQPEVTRGLGRVREGTPLILYALVYGLFLAVLVPAIFVAGWRLLRHQERRARGPRMGEPAAVEEAEAQVVGIVAGAPTSAALWRRLRRVLLIAPALLLAVTVTQPVLSLKLWLGALILLGAAMLLARRITPAVWFIIWMTVVGWAVSLGIELVYVRDHLDGGDAERMNTVFKFGFQVWVLLALAAAAALPHMVRWLRRMGPLAQSAGGVALAALLALALVFPLAGTPSRLATRFPITPGPTLDGLAFMDTGEFDVSPGEIGQLDSGFPIHISLRGDGAAIHWLNENIRGTPIVLQSDLGFYRAYGVRIAANTGLPTVVSPLHASEQHDPDQVAERDRDVQTLYRTIDVDQALQLLSKYRVGYVYVGQIERAAYGDAGMAKFDQMAGSYLNVVYDQDGVKIFEVNESVYSITPPPPGAPIQPVMPAQPPAAQPPAQPAEGEASLETLEQQVRLNPTVASLAFGLGQRYYGLGRYDDAISVLDRAATANPGDVPLHQLLGDVLRDAGRNEQAAEAYRAAAEASPTAGNYNKLGLHLLKMGALDKAAEAFQQAIAADPSVAEPFYHLGEIYEQQGQKAPAVEQYQKYLEIAPPDAEFRNAATKAIERLK
jgi:YYY domain-containing protein